MRHLADIYVILKTRSRKLGLHFINHFLPNHVESSDGYELHWPGYPVRRSFNTADELMRFLEINRFEEHRIYWRNSDKNSPNKHGMIFYTVDSCMIFGISRESFGIVDTSNEDECLEEMKSFFNTENGYITYESPPKMTLKDFLSIVLPVSDN